MLASYDLEAARIGLLLRERHSNSDRSDEWNAYSRQVWGDTVIITHPCHPLVGQEVKVLHYRRHSLLPAILVELPDLSTQYLPTSWTDRGVPGVVGGSLEPGQRLCPFALLEVIEWIEKSRDGD